MPWNWHGWDMNRGVSELRQSLLSATVENRSKREQLAANHSDALTLFDRQPAIAEITDALEAANLRGELPNPHVIRLVRNYFMETAVVVAELARVCLPGASVFMVNDNVQYHGEEVPVDLILSDLAEQCGFHAKAIWTLARGKGNASQQMGTLWPQGTAEVHLLVGATMSGDYRRLLSQLRSQNLTASLQRRLDMQARQAVADLGSRFGFTEPVASYLISPGAWAHIYRQGLNPVSAFCPPGYAGG